MRPPAPPSLQRFLSLLEDTTGPRSFLRATLEERVGADVLAVLRGAGLVREGAPCGGWDCADRRRGCAREIVENHPQAAKPLVAVCSGAYEGEDPCDLVELTHDEIACDVVAPAELARALQRLYDLEGEALDPRKSPDLGPDPVPLGTERIDGVARDVFLAMTHTDRAFPLFLALRERASRPTLMLVLTVRGLPPETATRYAPGGHVEVEALEDALAIRGGAIVKAAKLRLVKAARTRGRPKAEKALAPEIGAEIGATSFGQVKIVAVDGHTVRISCGKKSVRRTYRDLGLHAGNTREPNKQWHILMAVLEGRGTFRWRQFGEFAAVSTAMTRLRGKMCAAFGLGEDPFHPHHRMEGWKAKFSAGSEVGG